MSDWNVRYGSADHHQIGHIHVCVFDGGIKYLVVCVNVYVENQIGVY